MQRDDAGESSQDRDELAAYVDRVIDQYTAGGHNPIDYDAVSRRAVDQGQRWGIDHEIIAEVLASKDLPWPD